MSYIKAVVPKYCWCLNNEEDIVSAKEGLPKENRR